MKSKSRYLLLLILFISLFEKNSAQPSWQEIISVKDVYSAYPERMKTMLQAFNLELKGLEKVKQAYEDDNIKGACNYLLEYYKTGTSAEYLRMGQPPVSQQTNTLADSMIQDIFTFQLVCDKVPRLADGHLDWSFSGPNNDPDWDWALNRHYPVRTLLDTYFKTGNPKYATYIDKFIKDWVISSLPYPGVKSKTPMWRGLEVSFRVKIWARVFYGLINTGYISPATQLLILSSLPEHAHYAKNFHRQNNWLTMEISGLATVATAWPEFKQSPGWLEYAKTTMVESMENQVYDDGVQTELTSHYHRAALSNFKQFQEICRNANEPLPGYFNETIGKMYNYLAYTIRPDGYGLLNNDADRDYNHKIVLDAASEYHRGDWEYIASNGATGAKPGGEPSIIFPWAGHLISRSGYDSGAHWSFFDIGPWGSGHQHNDKLHISVSAFGRDLLVDGGRFAYSGKVAEKFRRYAQGSQSHNVVLIDGKGQAPGPRVTGRALSEKHFKITPEFDYAWGFFDKFNDLEGRVSHNRTLFYVRGNFWVVVDNIETDRPRKIETLWHWHPDCVVQKGKDGVVSSDNDKGNLTIIPVGESDWKVEFIKGQEKPGIQGWYSEVYNKYEPNTATVYSTNIKSNSTFAWVLFPSGKAAPNIQAKILSHDSNGVKVQVINPGKGEWDMFIPFSNSAIAKFEFNSN